jgi:putative ABC transport system permease protein
VGRIRLAWQNIVGDRFRSLAIFVCAFLVAALALTATFVVRGAEAGLRDNLQRLGADILVLPWGTMTDKIGGVRLVSADIGGWMPRAYMDKIAQVEGVVQVSPQLHLDTLANSPFCHQCDLYLVAFDPATDFTLSPWVEGGKTAIGAGEAYAGSRLTLPESGKLALYGDDLTLRGRLAPTGTSIDQTVFVSFETALAMQTGSAGSERGLQLQTMPESISATMVRLELGSDAHEVAIRILEEVPGVVPLETPNLFRAERRLMIGILRTLLAILAGVWVLAVVFMGMVFSIAVNERRQELGVLRALGFTSRAIFRILLTEGMILALAGGLAGAAVTALALTLGSGQVAAMARLPLQTPSLTMLLGWALGGQLLALLSVTLAALLPAWLISRQEVALTMRA